MELYFCESPNRDNGFKLFKQRFTANWVYDQKTYQETEYSVNNLTNLATVQDSGKFVRENVT